MNRLHSSISPTIPPPITAPRCACRLRVYKQRRRRKLKPIPRRHVSPATIASHLDNAPSPSSNPFQNLLLHFQPPDFPLLLTSFLGFASGAALSLSISRTRRQAADRYRRSSTEGGEWILFSSPTPFNRFVFLRCPLISFEGAELLDDVNERLVKEDRHFVRLDSGRIVSREGGGEVEEELEYQRVCVGTEDGGVISVDWPANLDLEEEHGLDTTLLLVPGTTEGSMDDNVRAFVCEALRHGFFPVVMNPRGCGGSPLTTARLFTAADSDDVSTAIQFINKARPWTTMMGVGWGFGANMLTKYLAEVGERTPLAAATCINNPFDLEEVTRSYPYHVGIDEKLTGGLVDILRSNKGLFQGRAKRFDVERALEAKSVREFEKAISMVSYGFDEIEDFYSESSTRDSVGNVKIPVLFIQNDDGTVPSFSVPRSRIAENPCTSLLLCSCLPSSVAADSRSALSWCQHLTIEWLIAVELGLLKGRHPLLTDIDVTISPAKGLSLLEQKTSDKGDKVSEYLELPQINALNGPGEKMLENGNAAASNLYQTRRDPLREFEGEENRLGEIKDGSALQISSLGAELVNEDETERGQVLQTAQVVMSMLDVTMPGTLTEDKKKKVLTAVNQGETLMKALQDAVPEDVREKLTTAVSGILHTQGSNLKLDGILDIGSISSFSSDLKSKNRESDRVSVKNDLQNDNSSAADQIQKNSNLGLESVSGDNQQQKDTPALPVESDLHSTDRSASCNEGQFQKHAGDSADNHDSVESSKVKAVGAERGNVQEREQAENHQIDDRSSGIELVTGEEFSNQKNEEKSGDSLTEARKVISANITEEAQSPTGLLSETQEAEKDNGDTQKRENKNLQPAVDQNKSSISDSSAPTFSVSQALDALTGMDDSTQVAVNSVFGVLEEMITQLEEGSDNENEERNKLKDEDIGSLFPKYHPVHGQETKKKEEELYNQCKKTADVQNDAEDEFNDGKPTKLHLDGNPFFAGNGMPNNIVKQKTEKKDKIVNSELIDSRHDRLRHVNSIPPCARANAYGDFLRNAYVQRYLFSKYMAKPMDKNVNSDLLLDYFPEEGQWKLLEKPGSNEDSSVLLDGKKDPDGNNQYHSTSNAGEMIEPSFMTLDHTNLENPVGEYETINSMGEEADSDDTTEHGMMHFVRKTILDCLKVEVDRKRNIEDMKELGTVLMRDCEHVADAVCSVVGHSEECIVDLGMPKYSTDEDSGKLGIIQGENLITVISCAVQETTYLRRILPVGVVVGSCLATLRKSFDVTTTKGEVEMETDLSQPQKIGVTTHSHLTENEVIESEKSGDGTNGELSSTQIDQVLLKKSDQDNLSPSPLPHREERHDNGKNGNGDKAMAGVVAAAALGTSALLVQQQKLDSGDGTQNKEPGKLDEASLGKEQNNIVTSLAEKAMSVAGPVVPTKEDGEVDQERLVAMLADLGQRGGMLKLVGKIALLWGGLRGAMSLTDKLISFLRMAERPLYQRIVGFVAMVLVLWSPVVIPLFPTLVQTWMSKSSSGIADFACIFGLYVAVAILIMLWGKRIRGYERPLNQYGLDLMSLQKIRGFLRGLIGGVVFVVSIQYINSLLGFVCFTWPPSLLSSSLDTLTRLKFYGQMLLLVGQGAIVATAVALVEELLFRSWLHEEIAADLGFHRGVIMSGLAFSLFQRSPWAIPGLWLLSFSLAGLRQRSEGSLFVPIGLRAGMILSSYTLQRGGFLTFKPDFPLWMTGTHPFQPLSGVAGLTFSLVLAILLYPRNPRKKLRRTIGEEVLD